MLATLLTGIAFAGTLQVDLHLDTPHQLQAKDLPLDAPHGLEAGLSHLRQGGTTVPVMVLWPPRAVDHWAHVNSVLARLEGEVARLDELRLTRDPASTRAAVEAGRIAVLVSLEGAHGLGDTEDWRERLGQLQDRGLSLLGLTWSFSNRFAGSSGDGGGGLTALGEELVTEARQRGIVLDLSHASRQTTMELCSTSPVPVIASHSDAHALSARGRNLTDEEIRCIAATGGVIGLNFHAPFVGEGASVAKVADHADHIASVGGKGVVALGSDFDGLIKKPQGLPDAGQIPALWAELARRGWTEEELAGVRGENFMRAWEAVRAGAAGVPTR